MQCILITRGVNSSTSQRKIEWSLDLTSQETRIRESDVLEKGARIRTGPAIKRSCHTSMYSASDDHLVYDKRDDDWTTYEPVEHANIHI